MKKKLFFTYVIKGIFDAFLRYATQKPQKFCVIILPFNIIGGGEFLW